MPTEQMFWGGPAYGDKLRVPLKAYRCKAHLVKTVDGVNKPSGHQCRDVVDHEGDHSCICGKRWKRQS